MNTPAILIFDDPDVVRVRLSSLGLDLEVVLQCLMDAFIARSNCTDLDPPTFPSLTMWAVLTRSLRVRLAPLGWTRSDEANFSIVVNPESTIAVVVASGNEGTGIWDQEPSTKYSKGPATKAAVAANLEQLDLFDPSAPVTRTIATESALTWILLQRCAGDEVFAELSLPLVIGDDGHISQWRERIILPRIDGARGPDVQRRTSPESGIDLEVAVVRRTA